MKRAQAIKTLVDSLILLKRVQIEFLATNKARPIGKHDIQYEISNIEDLIDNLTAQEI